MKFLTRFLIILICSRYLTNRLTELFFTEDTWSYLLGNLGFFVPVCITTGAIFTWAFETKVADLYYKDEKVGTMRESEDTTYEIVNKEEE